MNHSETLKSIAKALITFHVKVETVKKDAKNPFFKSTYASLSNILESINEPLIESGLCFSQFPSGQNELTTILIHAESGEYMSSSYLMKPVKDDPQGVGSVITYQRRYALASILGLNIEEDDDGNKGTHGTTGPGASTAKQEPKKDEKPWLNKADKDGNLTDIWKGAVKKLQAGATTVEKIEAVYKISKDNKAELLNIKKA